MDIFKELIPSLLENKGYLITSDIEEKEYNSYLVNKSLSGYMDCIFHVNEINKNKHIDNKLQYDYYYYGIRKYRRPFSKWIKKENLNDINIVKEYYNYSTKKAKEIIDILTEEQLIEIKNYMNKGGKIK